MKKLYLMLLTLLVVVTAVPVSQASAASADAGWLNTSMLNQGVIAVQYKAPSDKKTKVMITKGSTSYTYNLSSSKGIESFPLQQGSGSYKVSVLENTSGNKYRTVYSEDLSVTLKSTNAVYLGSVQNVSWNASSAAVQKAKQLVQGKANDTEKAKAIYNYIVSNISYDYALASSVAPDYLPSIDKTLAAKKGICYDYSSLYAAMLRSVNIPAKLVMGTTTYVKEYHAWNEVLLNGKWTTIDTTVDAGLLKNKKQVNWVKSAAQYSPVKYY